MSSFKSKQRAKHGHLFGDDPLNAALVSATDDPLFSSNSRTTSQSSRTNSPVSNDPLTRPSSSNGPLDISSSTPISASPRRVHAKANGSQIPSSGSIFGDIDVSKLGASNGHSKRVSNTSLRSTATLRSSKQYDLEDEEDLLFGGKSTARTRVNSKTSPDASIHKKSPIATHTTLLPKQEDDSPAAAVIPTPRKPTPPPVVVTPTITKPVEQPTITKPIEQPQETKVEQKPTVSSSSSSFFRFFKSSTTQSKPSSSASSAASVNAPSSPVVPTASNEAASTLTPSPPPPPPRQQTIQPQPRAVVKQQQQVVAEQEEEEEEVQHHQIIEDEATRAFADDVMTFKPSTRPAHYFSPELTMDALRIDTPPNKRLIPSVSTPTATTVDDPWSSLRQPILLNGPIEPSVSSPLVIKEQDIEPQKRTAFADLIASWNTGGQQQKQQSTTTTEDPEQFFSHVAEEKRDIGFAGIQEEEDEIERSHIIVDWVQAEENPWN